MMYNCYIIRYHEIALKRGNRDFFERKLVSNVKACLKCNNMLFERIRNPRGRIIVYGGKNYDLLRTVFGISSFSKAVEMEQDMKRIKNVALQLYTGGSFRISAKRSDKRFNLSSQQINEQIGDYIVGKAGAEVNLRNPTVDIGIEFFDGKAYVFNEKVQGLGGLPIGTAGKVAVLLEADSSIIAAYLMLKRGCSVVFIKKKSIDVNILEKYAYGSKIKVVDKIPFNVKALVVNDTISNVRKYDTSLVVLRPLSKFTKEGIERFLKKISFRK